MTETSPLGKCIRFGTDRIVNGRPVGDDEKRSNEKRKRTVSELPIETRQQRHSSDRSAAAAVDGGSSGFQPNGPTVGFGQRRTRMNRDISVRCRQTYGAAAADAARPKSSRWFVKATSASAAATRFITSKWCAGGSRLACETL